MRRVEGKVALVTGAAGGIGRSQAVRLAEEGADVIVVDLAESWATDDDISADLQATAELVRANGRRALARTADVRDAQRLAEIATEGARTWGHLDIVVATAGIFTSGPTLELPPEQWNAVLDVNLTGAWNTIRTAVPHIVAGGTGGAVVVTSSVSGLRAYPLQGHYVASKHGLIGLAKTLALELGPHSIRVNAVSPGGVATPMLLNEETFAEFAADLPAHERTEENVRQAFAAGNALPVPWVDPVDIANATLFLVSDEARYITGAALPVDAGGLIV
ncbi:MAG: mycofactocin-coupled SDR family oxidoreductase [Nocardioides sp.]|uniref:mycofactocin-coupled SDR family oxidoreductase n=1 Tax=Nocardioides sp. TaxID=35761 RepID=UPI0039E72B3E